jgi:hypothetical protein
MLCPVNRTVNPPYHTEDIVEKKTCFAPLVLLLPFLLSCSLFSGAAPSSPLPFPAGDSVPSTPQPLPGDDSLPSTPGSDVPETFRGVPVMPGVQPDDAAQFGTAFTYHVQGSVQEVKAYYLRELPLAGWEVEDITGDDGGDSDSIRIRCRKEGETIAVFIHPGADGRVEVTIL